MHIVRKSSHRFMLLFLLLIGPAVFAHAQQESRCDNRNLTGAFGFKINGSNPAVGPYSFVGRFVADGKGNVTGGGIQSVNGDISRPSFTGAYAVETDCTGEVVLAFSGGGTATLQFVIEADGTQVAIIVAGLSGPGGENEVGSATKQFIHPNGDREARN
jgi:hypothetical protein